MNTDATLYEQRNCYGMLNQPFTPQYHMFVDDIRMQHRATREFVPNDKKDDKYWFKRVRNNVSARKSRMKRKALDKVMERKLLALQNENMQLRNQLAAFNIMYLRHTRDARDASMINTDDTETQENKDPVVLMEEGEDTSLYVEDDYEDEYSSDAADCNIRGLLSSTSSPSLQDESESISPGTPDQSYLSIPNKEISANDGGDSSREDISSNSSGKSEMDDFRGDCESPLLRDSFSANNSDSVSSDSFFYDKQINGEMEMIKNPGIQSKAMRRRDSPTQGYLSLPLNAQAVMTFHSGMTELPSAAVNKNGNAKKNPKTGMKQSMQKVPHKIRIKEKLHSAFTKKDAQ